MCTTGGEGCGVSDPFNTRTDFMDDSLVCPILFTSPPRVSNLKVLRPSPLLDREINSIKNNISTIETIIKHTNLHVATTKRRVNDCVCIF